jgi:hypothetical protein
LNGGLKLLRQKVMRRDLERRLQMLETVRVEECAAEVWIEMANGMMRGPRG